jgi:hypothetical protein
MTTGETQKMVLEVGNLLLAHPRNKPPKVSFRLLKRALGRVERRG